MSEPLCKIGLVLIIQYKLFDEAFAYSKVKRAFCFDDAFMKIPAAGLRFSLECDTLNTDSLFSRRIVRGQPFRR